MQDSHSKGHIQAIDVVVIRATRGIIELTEKPGRDVASVDVQLCGIARIRHKD